MAERLPTPGPDSDTLNPPRVLFVQHTGELSGSTISGQLVVRGLQMAGWHVDIVLGSSGPGAAGYADSGSTPHYIPHKNWLRGGNVFQAGRRVLKEVAGSSEFLKVIRELKPDLVYINTIVSLAAAVAARRARVPCVWHIRELFEDVGGEMRIPPLVGKRFVRSVIGSCAAYVVLISEAVRENILGQQWQGISTILPNAVDDRFFSLSAPREECRKLFDLPTGVIVIGVPGTLRPMKGHEFFLKAAARILAAKSECLFAITGDGDPQYVSHLHQLCQELGIGNRVRFLGTTSQMPEFYRACDVICVPSRAEPFGRTVIEAFAVGTPVVASAVGGIRETVTDGQTGLLVGYDDVTALAQALQQLIDTPELRDQLAANGVDAARRRHSATAYHAGIQRIVQQVMDSRTGSRSVSNRSSYQPGIL